MSPANSFFVVFTLHWLFLTPDRGIVQTMNTLLDIGSALITARRIKGISQRELGDLLGVRQQQIARWEATAYRSADLERVDAVARELGLSVFLSSGTLLANEAPAAYAAGGVATLGASGVALGAAQGAAQAESAGVAPVRDLGEVAARIRAHGDEFRDRFHIERIGVFGSFVYGEQTAASDVDLLVDFRERPPGFKYFAPQQYCEELLGRQIDFVEREFLRERLRPRVTKDVVYVWAA